MIRKIKTDKLLVWGLLILLLLIEYFYIADINTLFITGSHDTVNRAIVYDARFYYKFVEGLGVEAITTLGLTANIFGPTAISYFFNNNLLSIFIFQFISLILAIFSLVHYLPGKKLLFYILLLFYPIMVGSLYGANKEIISYISLIFMLTYILSFKKKYLFAAFLFALLSRLELMVVYIIYSVIIKFKRKHRTLLIISLLLLISLYMKVSGYAGEEKLANLLSENSTGVSLFLSKISGEGLYFLAFPIKAVLQMYSGVTAGFNSQYIVTLFLFLSNIAFIVLTVISIKKKNFSLDNNVFLLGLIYLILFSTGALIHHRYITPVYVLLLYLAFFKQSKDRI